MIDHLWLRVADVARAKRFSETIAPHAAIRIGADEPDRAQFLIGDDALGGSLSLVSGDQPTEHVHLAFAARDDATVRAFHEAAMNAGHPDNGAPGERPEYHAGYYGAFVLDRAPRAKPVVGNNVEVVNHNR